MMSVQYSAVFCGFPRYIVGDEARLRQVLINLIGNAIKCTELGGVTLRLGTKDNKTTHLLIEVEDSGIGITPGDQQRKSLSGFLRRWRLSVC